MNKEHVDFLKNMGFTSTESKVYLTLLEMDESLAGAIASKSKLYRKNVYDSLVTLSDKGFVTNYRKNKKIYWRVVSPEKIRILLKEKISYANKIIPELLPKFNVAKSKQTVEVFQGIEGLKSFNDILLKEGKTIYGIGLTALIFERLKFSIPNYLEEAAIKGIEARFLVLSDADKRGVKKFEKLKNIKLKTLPKNFSSPIQIYVCGDYAGIWIWSEESLAILIKSKEITKGFKKYFDFMWDVSK
jgi:sugar-specific transcriptional regulator TrmB